ncbi:diacylglycerol kinase family protein [Streptomyces sp. NPDC002809]|uniref:diacylglycerol/lipid kinase family protein n=1 Tax=Streptomyces sp. NPDC002809 TaxID=3154433 RepID=UPI0033302A7A
MPGWWARTGLVVFNPVAGAGRTDRMAADAVVRRCERYVTDVTVVPTGYRGHAEELAAKAAADGIDVVIAVGGDGTTRESAAGLVRASLARPDGITGGPALVNVPGGTANSVFREVWSDRPWEQALDAALGTSAPRIRRVDMARIVETGTLALLGTGTGVVAEVLEAANRLGSVPGRDRYRLAVAETVRTAAPYPLRVTVDGTVVHDGPAYLTNIGGGRYRSGQFKLMPLSVLDDGLLDICVVSGDLPLPELLHLTQDGSHVDRPQVVYTRGRRFVLERTDGSSLTCEYDGESATGIASRCTVEILPGVLPVLAPSAEE